MISAELDNTSVGPSHSTLQGISAVVYRIPFPLLSWATRFFHFIVCKTELSTKQQNYRILSFFDQHDLLGLRRNLFFVSYSIEYTVVSALRSYRINISSASAQREKSSIINYIQEYRIFFNDLPTCAVFPYRYDIILYFIFFCYLNFLAILLLLIFPVFDIF